jgi:hypothetical protein
MQLQFPSLLAVQLGSECDKWLHVSMWLVLSQFAQGDFAVD